MHSPSCQIYHFTHDSGELPSAEAATYDAEQTYNTQNIRTGVYSTSYNRIVNSITNLKATEDMTTSGFVLRNKPPSSTPIKQADGVLATDGHLLVREQEQLALLEELLTDHPIGNQADTVLAVTTSSPHVSFIVDKAASLKPGAELFTLLLGPQKDDWKPFGSPNMFVEDQLSEKRRTPTDGMDPKFTPEYESASFDHPTEQSKNKPGCPIMMQTSPGIKLLVQVPKVSVNVALPSLVRFFLAHFVDLQLLKAYLESCKWAFLADCAMCVWDAVSLFLECMRHPEMHCFNGLLWTALHLCATFLLHLLCMLCVFPVWSILFTW